MDPFTAGILVTCGLIVINCLVLASIERSHHRGLAAAQRAEEAANRPGSSISTKTEDTDDPTRRLIKPHNKVRNYTDLQNSLDTRLHGIMNGLSYSTLSNENPPETSEMPQSSLDTSNSYSSSLGANESETKELLNGEYSRSSPDTNNIDNNPEDTSEVDTRQPQCHTSRQNTATCDIRQPNSTENTSSTPDSNLSNSGSKDTTKNDNSQSNTTQSDASTPEATASHCGSPKASKNYKRKSKYQ